MAYFKALLFSLVIACFGFLASFSVQAKEDLIIYVVDYPPYILVNDETNEVTGVDVDVTRAALASQGIDVEFQVMPWPRIIKSMEQGIILGTLSCSKRPGRDSFMLFSDTLSNVTRSLVSKNSFDSSSIFSLSDASKHSIVTVEGWGMQKQLVSLNIAHQAAPDIASAIKAVRYRNVDLLYMAEYPARYYIKLLGEDLDLKVMPIRDEEPLSLYVCLSRGYPEAEVVLNSFNSGLRHIKENGLYDQIRSQYLQAN